MIIITSMMSVVYSAEIRFNDVCFTHDNDVIGRFRWSDCVNSDMQEWELSINGELQLSNFNLCLNHIAHNSYYLSSCQSTVSHWEPVMSTFCLIPEAFCITPFDDSVMSASVV
jgi:hypothetical protein